MCGISGFVSFQSRDSYNETLLRRMNARLTHRGPDDEGYYLDQHAGLAVRRLSIIDLDTGHQPISNEDGSSWIVFNGEIYNYRQVRRELEGHGHIFKTQTDTEAILHAYEEYGVSCVQHFNGMFALAIWDVRRARLFLARDRLGIKPLFYWRNHQELVFGSELKALIAHPQVPRQLDLQALDQFLTLEYVPGPRTILENIYKLPPGHTLIFEQGLEKLEKYWNVPDAPVLEDEDTCVEKLASLIEEAVKIHLVSDVPLGAFLSGGIDSSTVVGVMSRLSSSPIQTFSIGFEEDSYNELPRAQAVAVHFGTDHHSAILEPDIATLAERLVLHLDEPLADTSIFPTYLVSALASQSVKVVLSGDGGDELFGGYDTYRAQMLSQHYQWLPWPVRKTVLPGLTGLLRPQPAKKGTINKMKRMVEGAALDPALQHARWMVYLNPAEKTRLYQSNLPAALNGDSTAALIKDYYQQASGFDHLAQQQYVDIKTYLVDDILTKVDRMSMAASIEARVPLLDHHIVEFAMNLPAQMKINRSQSKVILRKAVQKFLPPSVLRAPKQGFSAPVKHWLSTSLKPMMLDLLSEQSLGRNGYFNPRTVSCWIQEHLDGRVNHSHHLWPLMVFELWSRGLASF